MPQAFKMYRIVCTITGKSLVSGSDCPNSRPAYAYGRGIELWYERGSWSHVGGSFWKTEGSVKKHLQNLCHDWKTASAPSNYPRYLGHRDYWKEMLPNTLDWSRLQHLRVEQLHVTEYSTVLLPASDFMGIPNTAATNVDRTESLSLVNKDHSNA